MLGDKAPSESFVSYPYRWFILFIFAMLTLVNALLWVTFAPISDISEHYFGDEYGSITMVNLLANIFLILYAPGTILAVMLIKYYKLKNTLIVGGTLTVIGAFLRYMAALYNNSNSHATTYSLMLLGQAFAALAQPIFLGYPAALASLWFSVDERDIATTIGAMCSPIGNAVGQLVPVLIVVQNGRKS
jgi:FLVCR family MFS transporter 7